MKATAVRLAYYAGREDEEQEIEAPTLPALAARVGEAVAFCLEERG